MKCKLLSVGAIIFVAFATYTLGIDFYESYMRGTVKFQYHSNLFYDTEAVIMYICMFAIILIIALSSYFSIKKCFNNANNEH